jgi:biotin carboxyl carrier protein
MRYHVTIAERTYLVELVPDGTRIDGESADVDLTRLGDTAVHGLALDGSSHRVIARPNGAGVWELTLDGSPLRAEVIDERTRALREMTGDTGASAGPRPLTAPMPGLVVKVEVAAGDLVKAGQGLVIVEAMKMENELLAGSAGRVHKVLVEAGQTVEKGDVLVELAAPDQEDA